MTDPKDTVTYPESNFPNLKLCPFSRTFADKTAVAHCRGDACALFRWETVTTAHPLWKDAMQARIAETGEKVPYPKAAKWVAENKVELGLVPTKGYCGAGGLP
jgi:hypothetical protein